MSYIPDAIINCGGVYNIPLCDEIRDPGSEPLGTYTITHKILLSSEVSNVGGSVVSSVYSLLKANCMLIFLTLRIPPTSVGGTIVKYGVGAADPGRYFCEFKI